MVALLESDWFYFRLFFAAANLGCEVRFFLSSGKNFSQGPALPTRLKICRPSTNPKKLRS